MTMLDDAPTTAPKQLAGPALDLTGVTKTFDAATVVDDVDLSVERGSFLGLLGPNGAGKSTTIAIISGLIDATAGTCRVLGADAAKDRSAVRRMLGVVPQDLAIYTELSAKDNLHFFGSMYGLSGRLLQERIDDALRRVGLEDRARSPRVGRFSGGQKRRLNIAAALLHRPEVLILDEPTVGVDPQSRTHIFETLRELNREGTTILYVTHYMEEVEALCDDVAIMDHGRVIERGPLAEVLDRHGRAVARLGLTEDEMSSALAIVAQHPELDFQVTGDVLDLSAEALGTLVEVVTKILSDVAPRPAICEIEPPSLETVFMKLTGSRLRD